MSIAIRARLLVERASAARRRGDLDDAARLYAEAVDLCRQGDHRRGLIVALKGVGQIARDRGRNEEALRCYEEAVRLCREERDAPLLAHTLRHVADIHHDAGRLDQAEPCYRETLAIYRSSSQAAPLDVANALRPFALLSEARARSEEAARLWEEARTIYAALRLQAGIDECVAHLDKLGGATGSDHA